ncbi:remodeling and spacing factor 1 [Nematostella vectensis]|uniref:remodeling and spacing factor 1 n=1 Tax=Nematostella vectensis TaxID=45351 RepID=UPI00207702CB|nr:remodeling and spacing factor 1 [Nematostella vectensis]
MASTRSSDCEQEEDNGDPTYSPKKIGRAAEYPGFAIIWSFLENFCEVLRFPDLSLDNLEDAFNSHSRRNENFRQLEFLHKKLLSKLHKSFKPDNWEKILLKVAKEYNVPCCWDLENFGYDELTVSSKLELFKMCLEGQFDSNSKLKENVNKNYEPDDLRLQPFGRDVDGLIYWFHTDEHGGVRLYSTEEDEVDTESWRLLASDLEELEEAIDILEVKSVTNPKEIALAKREEEKKELAKLNKNKKKGKKSSKKDEDDDDNPCARCFSNVQPDTILLCDKCDAAYHTACLRPPLLTIPQGDWFCPFCQQLALLERLKERRNRLMQRQRLRARQAKRLCKHGINLSNILQGPGSDEETVEQTRRSNRSRKTVDYTFKEFEEEIQDAVGRDKKLKTEEEMNGHPTGKPAFAVSQFYGDGAARKRTRKSRRLRDLDSPSDSDSKTSEYEYDGSSDEEPKRPERHVYLRRHYRIDDEDEEETEEDQSGKEDKKDTKDEDMEKKDSRKNGEDDENVDNKKAEEKLKNGDHLVKTESKDAERAAESGNESDESGFSNQKPKEPDSEKDKKSKEKMETGKSKAVSPKPKERVPLTKPPPLSSPKIDPLLDSLGFGALGSSFANTEISNVVAKSPSGYSATSPSRRLPPRPDPYISPTATAGDRRYPARPDPMGYSPSEMGVPSSPLPRPASDPRYGSYPYGQSAQYGNYFNYNQDFAQAAPVGVFAGSPQLPPSYSQAMNSRQYPGFSPTISNRETSAFTQTPQSPSYRPPPAVSRSPYAGFPPSYPRTDSTTPRTGFYPASSSGFGYQQPSSQYVHPDDPFGAITGRYATPTVTPPLVPPMPWTGSQDAGMYYPPAPSGVTKTAGQQGYS